MRISGINRMGVAWRAVVTSLACLTSLALAAPAASAPPGVSWTGAGAVDTWSNAANWSTGAAPSGSGGTLALPAANGACTTWACSYGVDDIPSLSLGTLQIDASAGYLVVPQQAGDSILLQNGLAFSTAATTSARPQTAMTVPLGLSGPQSWTVAGVPGAPTQLTLGAVTGERYPLTLQLSGAVELQTPELDTGPLTISGSGSVVVAPQTQPPADGVPVSPPPLVGPQGVRLQNGGSLAFAAAGAVSGPIAVAPGSFSTLEVGRGVAPDATVVVTGDVALRADTTFEVWIDQPAVSALPASGRAASGRPEHARRRPAALIRPLPGLDYSQLTALGTVTLGDAGLELSQGYTDTLVNCASLAPGQVYTLISATTIDGQFARVPNGQVLSLGACNPLTPGPAYAAIIDYNTRARPATVTARIVGQTQVDQLVARTLAVPAAVSRDPLGIVRAGGYTTTFDAPATGTLTVTWTTRIHHRFLTLARATNNAGQVGERRVPIRLSSIGRRVLLGLVAAPTHCSRSRGCRHGGHRPGGARGGGGPGGGRPLTISATATFNPNTASSVTLKAVTVHRSFRAG